MKFDFRRLAGRHTATLISLFAKVVTSPRIIFTSALSKERQTVYYANHTSNGDAVLIWCSLPPELRRKTRPVAAADYWLSSRLKNFIGKDVFNILPIERHAEGRTTDPIVQMMEAINDGSSLIVFPEGRRNETEQTLLPLKPGIFHLAQKCPDVDFVPVWIDNLSGVMPRGEVIPVPLICTLTFGPAFQISEGESKDDFMSRAKSALFALTPTGDTDK
jgi:1-acyl-sn-glycerol-3-phosphate acyltransferase